MKYDTPAQKKNLAWVLPRPIPSHYKGSMPLHCEDWLVDLAKDLLEKDNPKILNLFCGMNKHGVRVDLNPEVEPDYLYDCHHITDVINEKFDFILADPPYSDEESEELYGMGKINYKQWTSEADKLLNEGGLLTVYHKYMMPNPNPELYVVEKRVFIGTRTYHLPRVAIYFRKHNLRFI